MQGDNRNHANAVVLHGCYIFCYTGDVRLGRSARGRGLARPGRAEIALRSACYKTATRRSRSLSERTAKQWESQRIPGRKRPRCARGNQTKQLIRVNRPDGISVKLYYEGDSEVGGANTGRLKVIRQPLGDTVFNYFGDFESGGKRGQLKSVVAPDGGQVSFTWDGSLFMSSMWSGGQVNGSVSYAYNTRSFVEGGVSKTGSDFWVASESVNGAHTVNISHDLDGLISGASCTVNGSSVSYTISRDPVDPLTGIKQMNGLVAGTNGVGVIDEYAYNGFGETSTYSARCTGTQSYCGAIPFFKLEYEDPSQSIYRDALGRIVFKRESKVGSGGALTVTTLEYQYDLAGRLWKIFLNGNYATPATEYEYDSNSNRIRKWINTASDVHTESGTYDSQDRLLTYSDGTNVYLYEYTANGELWRKTNTMTGEVWTFDYNVHGDLIRVVLPNKEVISYAVDGRNRRIGKLRNGVLEKGFLYSFYKVGKGDDRGILPRIVAELDSTGQVVSRFVYGVYPNVPAYLIKNGRSYRFVVDHLGSVRKVIDSETGLAVQEIEYDEFGKVLSDSQPGFQPFRFAGGLYDTDTKLIRFGARDYDAEIGRFTAKDPRLFYEDYNLYVYALNDPINKWDLTGMATSDAPSSDFLKKSECLGDCAENLERCNDNASVCQDTKDCTTSFNLCNELCDRKYPGPPKSDRDKEPECSNLYASCLP